MMLTLQHLLRFAVCSLIAIGLASVSFGQTPSSSDAKAPDSITEKEIAAAIKKVTYKQVGDVSLQLHIFYPEGHKATDRRPAIVFFFGGGWVGGSPQQFYKQAWYLSQRGMVAACAEYRIKSKHSTTPQECVKDGKSAIRFLRANASQFGIDPNKIAAGGGSAGGHVAAATATVTKFNEASDDLSVSPKPCALVLFNPVLDNGPEGWGHAKVKDYWKDISPIHNVVSPAVPSLFMLGSKDKLLPVGVAENYKKVVEQHQGTCTVLVAEGAGHGYFNRGQAFLDTLTAADRFLASVNLLDGEPLVDQKLKQLVMSSGQAKKGQPKKKKGKPKAKQKGEKSGDNPGRQAIKKTGEKQS